MLGGDLPSMRRSRSSNGTNSQNSSRRGSNVSEGSKKSLKSYQKKKTVLGPEYMDIKVREQRKQDNIDISELSDSDLEIEYDQQARP